MTRIIPSSDPVAMTSGVRATIASIEAGCPGIRSTADSRQSLACIQLYNLIDSQSAQPS